MYELFSSARIHNDCPYVTVRGPLLIFNDFIFLVSLSLVMIHAIIIFTWKYHLRMECNLFSSFESNDHDLCTHVPNLFFPHIDYYL